MSPRDRDRRRILSSEERVLWSTVIRSVAPLRPVPPPLEEKAPTMPPSSAKRAKPIAAVAASATTPAVPPLAPLGRRMRQRVARGREAIDARLDLHGLTQSEAHAALLHFLRQANARGARLVLVITGKGRAGAGGERGILRRHVPQWLGLPEFRAYVIGFEDAHVAHGGEGALYVRLRKIRGG